MTKLIWGAAGERFFEAGVDRGVLYVPGLAGVAWNGLKAVSEAPSGGEPKPYYIDGFKYVNVSAAEEFNATLEAFSSPAEFAVCDGSVKLAAGLFVTQQPRKSFGLSYRTLIGNDVKGLESGYKIHLVYNALASSAGRNNNSVSDSVDPMGLSWDISTRPPSAAFGYKPTAHFVIDSTKTDKDLLAVLEAYLYGANGLAPAMPTTTQLVAMFSGWVPLNLAQSISVVGTLGTTTATLTNLMTNPSFEAVTAGTTVARTNLATNPSFETGLAGANVWAGTGGTVAISRVIAGGPDNGGFFRETWTVASTVSGGLLFEHGAVLQPNTKYTFSAMLRSSVAQTIGPYGNFYNGATIGAGIPKNKSFVLPANVWTRVDLTAISGPNDITVDLNFYGDNLFPIGATLDLDQILVEQTDQIRPYFDGSTPDALGFDYGWTGATNASTSTAKAAVTEVRRNLCVNPNFETDILGWTAEAGVTLTRETVSPISGTGSMKMATGGDTYTQVAMAIGEVITFSVDYKTVGTVAGTPRLYSAAPGAVTQTTALPLTQSSPGRYSVTSAPAVTAGNIILAVFGPTTGGSIIFDNVLIEKSTVAGTYFDGGTAAKGDFINAWLGTINASASVQQGIPIANVIASLAATIQSNVGKVDGNKAIRVISQDVNLNSFGFLKNTNLTASGDLIAGKTYTVLATVYLDAPLTGSVNLRGLYYRSVIMTGNDSYVNFVNVAGFQTIRLTFTVPIGETNGCIRLYNSSAPNNGDVWYDNVLLVEGAYTGPYFDGDSADFVYRNQVVNPGWSGVAHSSTTITPYLTDLPPTPIPGSSYIVGGNLWVANNGTWTNYGLVPGGLF